MNYDSPVVWPLLIIAALTGCSKGGSKATGAATNAEPRAGVTAAADGGFKGIVDFPSDSGAWVNGRPMSLTAARDAPVLVEAWNRACSSCLASIPAVLALSKRYADRGLAVASVAEIDGDLEAEKGLFVSAMREKNLSYPCFLDVGGAWHKAANVQNIPTFLVVYRGAVVERHVGELVTGGDGYERLAKAIEESLRPPT